MSLFGFIPVALFLLALLYLDSYKLVRLRTLVLLIAVGCVAAAVSLAINEVLLQTMSRRMLTRYAAPVVEEILKAIPVLWMIRTRRIGFLIDAAICGFAVGAGFALTENLYYFSKLAAAPPALWVVRGFGTAVMHGGTTAIFAIVDKSKNAAVALVIAIVLHSLFNHFLLPPAMTTLLIVLVLPPLMVLAFAQSERYLQDWLGTGFDLDASLIKAMRSGQFAESHAGQYLQSLREHFDGSVLADMLCYLQLHAELSLRAKGVLMMRESGFAIDNAGVSEKLTELKFLKQSIGKTGELAIAPLIHRAPEDLWQLQLLRGKD
ncbi:MAG TPA: PrsW family glutamic-type intramembrane protease [Thermoanaerobaculia bacterium]